MKKISAIAGGVGACAGLGLFGVSGVSPDASLIVDYPQLQIEQIAEPSAELQRFISTQAELKRAWEVPGSRLRIDPRLKGIKSPKAYEVEVTDIKDGDTISVVYKSGWCGWFPCSGSKGAIRIWAIDSGETKAGKGQSRASCDNEISAGIIAKGFTQKELSSALVIWAYNLRADPYSNRWVASLMYQNSSGGPMKYFHVEALQYHSAKVRGDVFAFYDPSANKVLNRGGNTGFKKRKIWCEQAGEL